MSVPTPGWLSLVYVGVTLIIGPLISFFLERYRDNKLAQKAQQDAAKTTEASDVKNTDAVVQETQRINDGIKKQQFSIDHWTGVGGDR